MAARTADYAAANLTPQKVVQAGRLLHMRENTADKLSMLNGLAELCRQRVERNPDAEAYAVHELWKGELAQEISATIGQMTRFPLEEAATRDAASSVALLLADDPLWDILSAGRGFGLR